MPFKASLWHSIHLYRVWSLRYRLVNAIFRVGGYLLFIRREGAGGGGEEENKIYIPTYGSEKYLKYRRKNLAHSVCVNSLQIIEKCASNVVRTQIFVIGKKEINRCRDRIRRCFTRIKSKR